jgi:hypothetical protein
LRGNCLLEQVVGGEVEGRIEVTGRRGRILKPLLDNLKEKRRCWELKEETLHRPLQGTRFGRVYGPDAGKAQ